MIDASAHYAPAMKLSVPVRILLGVLAGLAVGLALNAWWSPGSWAWLGVNDAAAFLARTDAPANAQAGVVAGAARLAVEATNFTADVFLRALRFIAVPLVLFSLIAGVAALGDVRRLGRIGLRTVTLFVVTTVLAIVIGLVLVNLVQPGHMVSEETRNQLAQARQADVAARQTQATALGEQGAAVWRMLLSAVPTNPFDALARGDMLQVVVMALVLGAGLTLLPQDRRGPLVNLCESINEVFTTIIHGLMWIAPVAVFCLMVRVAAGLGTEVVAALGVFCATVVGGLVLLLVVVYAPLVWLAGANLWRVIVGMAPAQLLAFSTSSSAATLPVTMRCVRENLGVSERTTSFVCSLGATINMDGTALYQAISAVFIAQLYNMDLTLGQQLTLVAATTLSAIGAPGIPGGGIVVFVVVLQSVGIPLEGLAVILAVDRLLDMFRTVINVTGDAVGAVVIERLERSGGHADAAAPVPSTPKPD